MPTVLESLAKLSASMAELSQRAKEAEDHIAAARKETHEQLETRVAEAKAIARRRREEMKTRGTKVNDQLASAWASLVANVQEQFEKMRAKLGEKRDDLDAKAAQQRAERAEANAAVAVDFAQYASTKPRRRPSRLPMPGRPRMPNARAPHRRQVRSDVRGSHPHRDLVVGSGETGS